MKLADYININRFEQGHFWTAFSMRCDRLAKNIPSRIYYAKDETELHDVLDQLASKTPLIPGDQAHPLITCDIWDLMKKLPFARCAVILNKSCQGLKELVLATISPKEDKYGEIPLIRVKWDKSKKDFATDRLASQTYLNQLASDHGY
jgi:hypothetical protein